MDCVHFRVSGIWHWCHRRLSVSLYWSMNGQTGCPEPERMDRAMETEGISSSSYEFSHEASSSRVSHNVANKIGGGSTYLTGFGSVYHSRREAQSGQDGGKVFTLYGARV